MPAGSNAYNRLWQVRTDAWSALEESTAKLALAGVQQHPVEQLTDPIGPAPNSATPASATAATPSISPDAP